MIPWSSSCSIRLRIVPGETPTASAIFRADAVGERARDKRQEDHECHPPRELEAQERAHPFTVPFSLPQTVALSVEYARERRKNGG